MNKRRGHAGRGSSRKSRIQTRPELERFEDRLLLSVFNVSNTSDTTSATANDGSLRGAILASNASSTSLPNVITFSLPTGVQTISPVAALPAITQQVAIDGTTQAGFDPNNPKPLIQISGNNANLPAGPALVINSGGCAVLDLIINKFTGDGIDVNGGNDVIAGCYIGVDPTGGVVAKNTGVGILVASPNNTIGEPMVGVTKSNPNVISGNITGIQITGGSNKVSFNYVGTDATGLLKLGNTFDGIDVTSAKNTIGGINSGSQFVGNLISGNTIAGLNISNAGSDNNLVEGNFIGTDKTGLGSIGNSIDGIDLVAVQNTTIGGTVAGAANVISGNGFKGIQVSAKQSALDFIQGNLIGVAVNKISPLGNGDTGVLINGASQITVGGSTFVGNAPQFGNIIAYNGKTFNSNGVEILSATNDGILSNSIFNNGGLGIKLNQANAGIRPPTLLTVESGAAETRITGTYFGSPNLNYRLQFFSNQSPNASGFGDGQNYLGDLDITTDNLGKASFTTILTQGVPVGSFVSSTATEDVLVTNNTSQFGANVQATQAAVTDLAVSTAVPATGPFLNQNYTYTVTVTNNGPNDSTGVVLTDTIPTNSTFISSSAGTFAGGTLTDNIGQLNAFSSVVVTITVKPNSTSGAFVNTAMVTGDELDTNLLNNTSTTMGTVLANSDLSVTLTPSSTTAPVGSPITYSLTVANNGPSTANGTVVTVTFPATFTNIVVSPDQGSFSVSANNTVTINTGILPAFSSSSIIIMATPTVTGVATADATVTSSLPDPNLANNDTGPVNVTVANAADLGVDISASPSPVLIGQELFYTIHVTNNGPSAASSPVMLDTLPANVTYVPGDSTAGTSGTLSFASGVVTANLSALIPGNIATITIAVIPTLSGQLTNTVTVGDPNETNPVEIDPDLTNNTASTITLVSPADVGVTVLNPTDPLFIGTQAVYQIQVTNSGPATATNVILTDTFGAGATIVSTSVGTISGSTVTANLGTLASGASTTIMIAIDPTVSGTLFDSAIVKSDELDPNPNNDTSSSSNLVSPVDLGITVATSPSSPNLVGQPLTYVFTVTNGGPATATNVLFSNSLPAGATLNSLVSSQGALSASGTSITGNLGDLASGASATVTIVITPSTIATATDSASVTSDNFDTNLTNNTVTTNIDVTNQAGTIQLASPIDLVAENAGFVTLNLVRVNGSLGTISVDFATADFTALAGVNYVQSSGTVTFVDGQLTASITIPVLDDQKIDGNNGFFVTLSNPGGGASIGAPATAAVIVINTDRDTTPPFVSSLIAIPNGSSINGFIITFDEPMDPFRASLTTNYHIFLTSNKGQSEIPLAAAVYNPTNNSVTLIPTASLPSNRFYHIIVNGSVGPALTDTSGNILFGSTGLGTNYEAFYGQGNNLVFNDSQKNLVTIKLSGGGTLAIFRAANGDASTVNLFGIVPHKSKLTGSVKKLTKSASGSTHIGSINGFGRFGDVFSTLTTPSFYVGSAPISAASLSASTSVTALALPTSTVTQTMKTPKGPLAHKK